MGWKHQHGKSMTCYQSSEWNSLAITSTSTLCWADPLAATGRFSILNPYEYSPLVIEASILSDEKSVRASTNQLSRKLDQCGEKEETKAALSHFLETRENFLLKLRLARAVRSFVRFTIENTEEAKKNQEEIKTYLGEIGAIQDLRRELFRVARPWFEGGFLIDSIREATLFGSEELKNLLVNYIKDFNSLLRFLVIERAQPETVYTILSAEVQFIAIARQFLRTDRSIAIPLDLSPLRLSLAILREQQLFDNSRIYYPPLFLLFNPDIQTLNLARPYRTIDGHPAFIRAPRFEADKSAAQRETFAARENFEREVWPLLRSLKGLAGTAETAPSLIMKPLVQVILSYLSFNPLSKEMLRVIDFGCGTGALLQKIIKKVYECLAQEGINVYAFLNDDSHEDPGNRFRRLSLKEPYAGLLDSRSWKGDMRELVRELDFINKRFDIAFINRVLDMYGGYGIFEFRLSPRRVDGTSSAFYEKMQAKEPNVGDVIAFSESTCHEDVWRAIKYIFDRQVHRKEDDLCLLPSIDMKMKKNFFDFREVDTLRLLLAVSKLLVISVFPGNFETLFPDVNSAKDDIFHCEKSSSTSYSIICMSKSKELIEHIRAQCSDFASN